jgi:serine protease inhibitor
VNAVYFNGKWSQPFNSEDTNVGKFHISKQNQVDVPMMHIKTYFGYKHVESLKVGILELPYEVRSPH